LPGSDDASQISCQNILSAPPAGVGISTAVTMPLPSHSLSPAPLFIDAAVMLACRTLAAHVIKVQPGETRELRLALTRHLNFRVASCWTTTTKRAWQRSNRLTFISIHSRVSLLAWVWRS
jgi:hypothetical protein